MGVDESSRRTFELLANETRLGIISALGEASGEGGYATLTFSELQEATGVEDNGHFNYHLQELVGEFVEDREDGYALTLAGIRAYQAIVARVQRDSLSVEPFEIDGTCPNCGETKEAWYENSRAQIGCRSCGKLEFRYPVSPESIDGSEPETLLNALDRQLSRDYLSMFNGVCPYCAGRSTVQLAEFEEYYEDLGMASTPVNVHAACDSCAWFLYGNLGALLIFEPPIYSFLRERGVDLWEEYVWEPTPDHEVTNVSWEPQRVAGVFGLAGEELRYVLDEDLRLLEYEIVSGD
ncbi:winged helix-turn-helix domain-containing protein [Halobaculum magnesiiphilum]|uniref:Helix-turn-helix domain-containing protein n=1 Tax=Halobaculum magnesiiphilum TaxID=1017351 RepID=A0A8T8WC91_9EURY|nr:helix-turn-helix domain-containing protein [Halobaculum magnesiiphilum]QZP37458.1 helix-turn-helix domain-containing protein [Halobaculum magnesiiphilum]